MSTPNGPPPSRPPSPEDLTFLRHDLGRDELDPEGDEHTDLAFVAGTPAAGPSPPTATPTFHVVAGTQSAPARKAAGEDLPWVTRDGAPPQSDRVADSPWTVRRSDLWMRTSTSTMRRLRQEAINLSWTAAWLAVTASRGRRRG